MRERHTGAAALALVLTMTLVITACASSQQAVLPTDPGPVPAYLRTYAECWADTARGQQARPPAATFNSADAAQLRCRHLAPGAEHYLRRDEHGEPVHLKLGGWPVPRYDYSPEAHAACLTDTKAWFRESHPQAGAGHPDLFAETVCAVPPPQYTNVED